MTPSTSSSTGGVIAEAGTAAETRAGATVIDADGLSRTARSRRSAHPPARARLRGRARPCSPARALPRRAATPRCSRWPNTSPVADTAGVVEQELALGEAARLRHGAAHRRRHRGAEGRAARRARRHGPSRAASAGLQRRRLLRVGSAHHAPRARVREGLRRRRRSARAGSAPHRGRPDERGRRVGSSWASPDGPRSPRSRSSPATSCSRSTSARACTCATSPPRGPSTSIRWAKRAGIDVTAEVTPHHLLLTEELARGYDARYKVNPPLRREEDVLAVREASRTARSTSSPPTTPRTPPRPRSCEWQAAANGMVGLESALARRSPRDGRVGPAELGGRRPRDVADARRASAGSTGYGTPSRSAAAQLHALRPRGAAARSRHATCTAPQRATRPAPGASSAASCTGRGCATVHRRATRGTRWRWPGWHARQDALLRS